mmetsp:Transcript_10021/g.16008  ORF Transcript_10021/g.16008 Transcript_10021/m.16008 type:complete len:198 (+) Transcript_10021:39-632(+)
MFSSLLHCHNLRATCASSEFDFDPQEADVCALRDVFPNQHIGLSREFSGASETHAEISTFSSENYAFMTAASKAKDYDPRNPLFVEWAPHEMIVARQEELLLKQIRALEKAVSTSRSSGALPLVQGHYAKVLNDLRSELLILQEPSVSDVKRILSKKSTASTSTISSTATPSSASRIDLMVPDQEGDLFSEDEDSHC